MEIRGLNRGVGPSGFHADSFIKTIYRQIFAPRRTKARAETGMNTLKFIWLTLVQLVKQIPKLPQAVADSLKQRRASRPPTPREIEAERIDRIRFPSKYRGK